MFIKDLNRVEKRHSPSMYASTVSLRQYSRRTVDSEILIHTLFQPVGFQRSMYWELHLQYNLLREFRRVSHSRTKSFHLRLRKCKQRESNSQWASLDQTWKYFVLHWRYRSQCFYYLIVRWIRCTSQFLQDYWISGRLSHLSGTLRFGTTPRARRLGWMCPAEPGLSFGSRLHWRESSFLDWQYQKLVDTAPPPELQVMEFGPESTKGAEERKR